MKQIVEQAPIEVQYPHYISNQPKGEDLFKGKSQERLALVIAMHILDTDTTNNSVFARLIGLEGKWGSGKSNVIKLLEVELNKKGAYTFFQFDAWGNQEDLQRRCRSFQGAIRPACFIARWCKDPRTRVQTKPEKNRFKNVII